MSHLFDLVVEVLGYVLTWRAWLGLMLGLVVGFALMRYGISFLWRGDIMLVVGALGLAIRTRMGCADRGLMGRRSPFFSSSLRCANAKPSNQAMQLTASKPADLRLECLPATAYAAWHAQRARGS